jgi:hypothetical protein
MNYFYLWPLAKQQVYELDIENCSRLHTTAQASRVALSAVRPTSQWLHVIIMTACITYAEKRWKLAE